MPHQPPRTDVFLTIPADLHSQQSIACRGHLFSVGVGATTASARANVLTALIGKKIYSNGATIVSFINSCRSFKVLKLTLHVLGPYRDLDRDPGN